MASRGLDGLTAEELCASRLGFWDEAFTNTLVRCLGARVATLVDVGCGLATAAHALLPRDPALRYVGVDADPERIARAHDLLEGASYAHRVELRAGLAERLPCADGEAEAVLIAMTLQHLRDPVAALRECARVLTPSGRLVVVEPDNLVNVFYFDGGLDEVNGAFRDLFMTARRARLPADIAVGPTVPRLLEAAGLTVLECFPYALGRIQRRAVTEVLARFDRIADIVAATAQVSADACHDAIERVARTVERGSIGHGGQVALVFVSVGMHGR